MVKMIFMTKMKSLINTLQFLHKSAKMHQQITFITSNYVTNPQSG